MKKFFSFALVVALASTAFAGSTELLDQSYTVTSGGATMVTGAFEYIGGTAGDEVAGYGITNNKYLTVGDPAGAASTKVEWAASAGQTQWVSMAVDHINQNAEYFLRWDGSWDTFQALKGNNGGGGIEARVGAGANPTTSYGFWPGTYQFVGKMTYDGSDMVQYDVYLNPNADLTSYLAHGTYTGTDATAFAMLELYANKKDSNQGNIGSLKIGDTYADVAPKAFAAGDTDRDFDVDIFDFNNLKSNFNPIATANKFSQGDFDNDGNTDIFDFNDLKTAFNPIGYAPAAGEVELQVNIATGEVTLVGDAASIDGFQITSAGGSLVAGALDLSGLVGMSNFGSFATFAAAGNLMGLNAVDGSISLGVLYDAGVDAQDLTFDVTGGAGNAGVVYVPEPASMALLALGGLAVIRRRRRA